MCYTVQKKGNQMSKSFKVTASLLMFFLIFAMAMCPPAVADEVPLYIKYRFQKETGRRWIDASHERQQKFLAEVRDRNRKARMRKQVKAMKQAQKASVEQSRRAVKEAKENARKQRRLVRQQIKQQKLLLRRQKAQQMRAKMIEKIRQAREKSKSLRR